jgi:hypothetical protein
MNAAFMLPTLDLIENGGRYSVRGIHVCGSYRLYVHMQVLR